MKRTVNLGLIQMTCSENVEKISKRQLVLSRMPRSRALRSSAPRSYSNPYTFANPRIGTIVDLAEEIDENSSTIQRLRELAN